METALQQAEASEPQSTTETFVCVNHRFEKV